MTTYLLVISSGVQNIVEEEAELRYADLSQ